MGQFDHIIDWFKKRHDALLDDLEPLESGQTRMMDFDGTDWNDVTPKFIAEIKRRIEEMELLVKLYETAKPPAAIRINFHLRARPFQINQISREVARGGSLIVEHHYHFTFVWLRTEQIRRSAIPNARFVTLITCATPMWS